MSLELLVLAVALAVTLTWALYLRAKVVRLNLTLTEHQAPTIPSSDEDG